MLTKRALHFKGDLRVHPPFLFFFPSVFTRGKHTCLIFTEGPPRNGYSDLTFLCVGVCKHYLGGCLGWVWVDACVSARIQVGVSEVF